MMMNLSARGWPFCKGGLKRSLRQPFVAAKDHQKRGYRGDDHNTEKNPGAPPMQRSSRQEQQPAEDERLINDADDEPFDEHFFTSKPTQL